MEEIEKEATVVRKSEPSMQIGESNHYRIYCYFKNTPVRNFELFSAELDAHSSNATIGHSEKAQEYIYIIQGDLILHTELGEHTLHEGDAMVFDSSIAHTYINQQYTLLSFMVINFYPNYKVDKLKSTVYKVSIFQKPPSYVVLFCRAARSLLALG